MSSSFPNGTILSLGTTYGSGKAVSAITNANPGVATSTAHGLSDGNIVIARTMASTLLENRVFRLDNVATNAFDLEGIDTSSTSRYPSGFGVGSVEQVTAWTAMSQVTDLTSDGGEQQFFRWTYLEDGRERQRPTNKSSRSMSVLMDYDPALSWHSALLAADLAGTVYALRAVLPSGAVIYWGVYVGFDGEPSFTINENQQVRLSLSLASPFSTRYAA